VNRRDGLRGSHSKYIEHIPEMAPHNVTDNRLMNYVGLNFFLFHSFYITHTLII
jgi:hypothetical protein